MPGQPDAQIRVASDVGGTFTDSIAYDTTAREFRVSKVPTTPDNRAVGTIEGLRAALTTLGRSGADVSYVGHGMTTATNAIIQRTGARVAFVTNEGFRDLLEIGRQNRPRLYDHRVVRTPPVAERADRYSVRGRMDERGQELTPLDEAGLKTIATRIAATDAEAVGVCFLHAYANPAHEMRAKEILEAHLGDRYVCASTELIREFREYERSSTTALNAYLIPVMDAYLGSLSELLVDPDGLGIAADVPVMVMEASGGLMTLPSARRKPVHTVLSGPAGGVVSAAEISLRAGFPDIVTMDMGGTSTDISLIINGKPQVTTQADLEGMPIRVPVVDINAIGAGGGSIASIDEGGALRVGPRSAEAIPGPACYGRGGTLPTVTDANLVVGRLGAETALGGNMKLDRDAASAALDAEVAKPLSLSTRQAATGVLRVANANMERGIRVVSVQRGHDPRDFALVPFGGAGPLHAADVAESLGIPTVLVPPAPGILCAMGILMSDLRHDLVATNLMALAAVEEAQVWAALEPLRVQGETLLDADGVPTDARRVETFVDVRYIGQSFELSLPIAEGAGLEALAEAFHSAHAHKFGHADRDAPVEIVNLRVLAVGETPPLVLPEIEAGEQTVAADALVTQRDVFFEVDQSWHKTPVYRREHLRVGNEIAGPAVIDEVSSTTLLRPGDHSRVDELGNIIITIATTRSAEE
ncbi:MAG: 5-oxoprolinase [Gammaproteobacteria bacterium]|nr:5-oxoprolinase [Gammaproteobacteria bacterium]